MEFFTQANYLILSAFVLILGGLALFIYSVLQKEQAFQKKEEAAFTKYREILEKAREQAQVLLDSTSATSSTFLGQTKKTSEHLEIDLDRVLQQIAQKHIQTLHTDTTDFEQDYKQKLAEFQKAFDEMSKELLQHAKEIITQQVEQTTASLTEKTSQTQKSLEEDLVTYKKAKLEKIDAEIRTLIEQTYRDVLKQSIPESVDQKLIIEALEKAKKEGVIAF